MLAMQILYIQYEYTTLQLIAEMLNNAIYYIIMLHYLYLFSTMSHCAVVGWHLWLQTIRKENWSIHITGPYNYSEVGLLANNLLHQL